ncbi:MAG TPA: septal ring lytic transglycosylase RlpA family protein [Stellaceae bacterium]|nr:septal ring lytic transglycosylase RlpA family protein [Stellaceae bacterium]
MPLRQTIGISLALMMASTGAIAKLPDKTGHHHTGQTPDARSHGSTSRSPHRAARTHHAARHWSHHGSSRVAGAELDSDGDTNAGRAARPVQIGNAAWYGLVGRSTSSGELLDTVTPTAAHRSLPLSSYAKVTSLDSGRSVIVKINDRGPYNRRFIIDLSPRAADLLGMRHAGVAAVEVEPVAGPAGTPTPLPTNAVYQTAAATVQ